MMIDIENGDSSTDRWTYHGFFFLNDSEISLAGADTILLERQIAIGRRTNVRHIDKKRCFHNSAAWHIGCKTQTRKEKPIKD